MSLREDGCAEVKRAVLPFLFLGLSFGAQAAGEDWLLWPAPKANAIAKETVLQGRVGPLFGTRALKTERPHNYKLIATWFTSEVLRATARVLQLREHLTDDATRALLSTSDTVGGTVVMVELDPREGSGVIPTDWTAFLQPLARGTVQGGPVRGESSPRLRDMRIWSGAFQRNYDYDRFWVVFPLTREDGSGLVVSDTTHLELTIRVSGLEGRVRWPVPRSLQP